MSRDIRSFFKPLPAKNNAKQAPREDSTPKKRPIQALSSDEEFVEATPEAAKKPQLKRRKKRAISSSDESDGENNTKYTPKKQETPKKPNKQNLRPANAVDILGSVPVKQSKVQKITATPTVECESKGSKQKKNKYKKPTVELGIHEDPDFEKTLLDLDDDLLLENDDVIDKTVNETLINTPTRRTKSKTDGDESGHTNVTLNATKSDEKKSGVSKTASKSTGDDFVTPKKIKVDKSSSSVDTDRDRFEKRQQSAILYQKYKNRAGPAHHGSKKLPQGKPDCLKNLCFIKTGVLDSLESEEFEELVKKHGGRTVKAVSRKVNYVVVGEEPGPAKLEKAKMFDIPIISEDEFLDIICVKSGMKAVYSNNGVDDNEADSEGDREKNTSPPPTSQKIVDKNCKNDNKINEKNNVSVDVKIVNEIPKETVKESSLSTKKITSASATSSGVKSCGKLQDLKPVVRKTLEVPNDNISWTEKYKPTDIKNIIGQQGEKSCMKKLLNWLKNWHKNNSKSAKSKIQKPSLWTKDHDGAYFKCALLSGPPGVGKTTTATLVARELGFDVVEFNASDTRSKKSLREEVAQLLNTTSLSSYVKADGMGTTKKRVLLMDEVDGMAGNEDRGGIQELISLINKTSVPVICMCNDRYNQKIRSLANYCFDLRFARPRLEQIKGAMMSVCFKEGVKISQEALGEIISGTGMDLRQTLNHLSVWSSVQKAISSEEAQKEARSSKKDTVLGPWEVCRTVFSEDDNKKMSLSDKFHLFFYDYNICPLFIQENYLEAVPHVPKNELPERVADTADAISMGDIISSKIRGSNNWSLLETQGLYSCVLPGHHMRGHLGGQINFPSWLGKNSVKGKRQRLLSGIHSHTRLCTSAGKLAINLDYAPHLYRRIVEPLIKLGGNGVGDAIEAMKSYSLLREDLDSLGELTKWPKIEQTDTEILDQTVDWGEDLFAKVDSKVKAAFTRDYNKSKVVLPYTITSGAPAKKKSVESVDTLSQEDEYAQNDEVESNSEEDDDINNDGMIKKKLLTKNKGKKDKGKTEGVASTSKKKGAPKGRPKALP